MAIKLSYFFNLRGDHHERFEEEYTGLVEMGSGRWVSKCELRFAAEMPQTHTQGLFLLLLKSVPLLMMSAHLTLFYFILFHWIGRHLKLFLSMPKTKTSRPPGI